MQSPSNGVSSYTSSWTSVSFENKDGYAFPVMIRMRARVRPVRSEVIPTTTVDNFASLGCIAPSSFYILTLHNKSKAIKLVLIN